MVGAPHQCPLESVASCLYPRYADVRTFRRRIMIMTVGRPRVQRVFIIRPPPRIAARFVEQSAAKGNVVQRFHGTSLAPKCSFGIQLDRTTTPCSDPSCGVCNICRAGWELERSGSNAGRVMALRYGKGVYFSATSGKSNDYSAGTERIKHMGHLGRVRWRTMFLCKVVSGNVYSTTASQLSPAELDKARREGADSVEGRVGSHLNYDELVIYNPACAVPTHLITYALYD